MCFPLNLFYKDFGSARDWADFLAPQTLEANKFVAL